MRLLILPFLYIHGLGTNSSHPQWFKKETQGKLEFKFQPSSLRLTIVPLEKKIKMFFGSGGPLLGQMGYGRE